MYLIAGLGNPGEEYAKHRHNVGFQSVSYLADRHGLSFTEKQSKARLAPGTIAGRRVVLAKPFTFMNASGQAVAALARWYKIDVKRELLVIYDDLDLPFGTLRLRANGSAGGQNGMKSIIEQLGTQEFARLRVGIGRPPEGWDPRDYVLGNWNREQAEQLPELYARIADATELFIREGIIAAMNRFNASGRDDSAGRRPAESRVQGGTGDKAL
ncbi:MAG TPA: aminoacyl-tRNA hydrolase [Herpetosiphonaceae bacterium]|nr:aminoacyl-tRNA hydrolase [Herpetosiphonaceae bacterium]